MKFYGWNIFSKTPFFRKMSLFLQGGWVVNIPTPSHSCHMSSFGGGGWVLKEIWSMSLNNPFFFLNPSLSLIVAKLHWLQVEILHPKKYSCLVGRRLKTAQLKLKLGKNLKWRHFFISLHPLWPLLKQYLNHIKLITGDYFFHGVKNTLRGNSPILTAEGHKTLTPPRNSCEKSEHVHCLLIEILR